MALHRGRVGVDALRARRLDFLRADSVTGNAVALGVSKTFTVTARHPSAFCSPGTSAEFSLSMLPWGGLVRAGGKSSSIAVEQEARAGSDLLGG